MDHSLLSIKNLSIAFKNNTSLTTVVKSISFDIKPNEILGVVGESGSGKSVSSLAIMGLLPENITNLSGTITFNGENLLDHTKESIKNIRGNEIAMIFQEPMSSLNPSMRCGDQVLEIINEHLSLTKNEAKTHVLNLFLKVKLPEVKSVFKKYPHELSGGQKQRVMIAMALACSPKLLIADEPTTALDVTVQKDIITLLKTIQKDTEMSVLFISHDLSLVSEIANRVIVMYQGEIVENGEAKHVFKNPEHIYTKALINSKPSLDVRLKQLPTIDDYIKNIKKTTVISPSERELHQKILYEKPPILRVINLEKSFFSSPGFLKSKQEFKAVNKVSFKLYEGETLGLVGESGCGKSTLSNAITQLDLATAGHIFYKGEDITTFSKKRLRLLRKDIQIIFQDPFASLNPRLTVGQAIMEPMAFHKLYETAAQRKVKVLELLERVGLNASHFNRYPHEFSGGQRQRIGIARTIALQPKIVICDESVSALDISVQAQVLNLLNELKEIYRFTYIFISHDLSVVKYMSDRLMVMNKGEIEEKGEADSIYKAPKKAYTKKLINAIPKGL